MSENKVTPDPNERIDKLLEVVTTQAEGQAQLTEQMGDLTQAIAASVSGSRHMPDENKEYAASLETTDQDIHRARVITSKSLKHNIRLVIGSDGEEEWRELVPGDKKSIFEFLSATGAAKVAKSQASGVPMLGVPQTAIERLEEEVLIIDSERGDRIPGSFMREHTAPIPGQIGGVSVPEIDTLARSAERFDAFSLRQEGPAGHKFSRLTLHATTTNGARIKYDPAYPVNEADINSSTRERITQWKRGQFEFMEAKDAEERYSVTDNKGRRGKAAFEARFGKTAGWVPLQSPECVRNRDGRNYFTGQGNPEDDREVTKRPTRVPFHEVHAQRSI